MSDNQHQRDQMASAQRDMEKPHEPLSPAIPGSQDESGGSIHYSQDGVLTEVLRISPNRQTVFFNACELSADKALDIARGLIQTLATPSNSQEESGRRMADAEKLRVLADWHDSYDDSREYDERREVQADLRRIAEKLAAPSTGGDTPPNYEVAYEAWQQWIKAGRCSGFAGVKVAIQAAFAKQEPPKGPWTSVTEKLAPAHETVLAQDNKGDIYQARVCYGMHTPFWCGHSGLNFGVILEDKGIVITHWRFRDDLNALATTEDK